MNAFFITDKSYIVLLSKYHSKDEIALLKKILIDLANNEINLSKGPILLEGETSIIISNYENLIFISFLPLIDCNLLEVINEHNKIYNSFSEHNSKYIIENKVDILLMLDFVKIVNNKTVLKSFIQSYDMTDEISENYIGKAKEYNISKFEDYINNSQTSNYESYFDGKEKKVLIDFYDWVDFITMKGKDEIFPTDCEILSQLKYKSSIKEDIEISFDFNYKIKNLSLGECVKSTRDKFLSDKNLIFNPNKEDDLIATWIPKISSYDNFIVNEESTLNSLNLPFSINFTCFSKNSVSTNIIRIQLKLILY